MSTKTVASLGSKVLIISALTVLVVSGLAAPVHGRPEQPSADSAWRLTGLVYVGTAPFQLLVAPGIEYTRVYHRDRNPLWDRAHIKGRASVLATPTSPGAQLDLEWMPLLPVILRARYSLMVFTGIPLGVGPGMPFDSASEPFDADTLNARQGEEETAVVQRATLSLTLRARLWRIFVTNELELAGWYVPGDSNRFYYEMYYDSMVARGKLDGTLANKSMLLFRVWKGAGAAQLLVGAVNDYSLALRADIDRDRVGGIVVLTPSDKLLGVDRPTIMLASGATLLHRHRKDEFWAQLAITLGWDLS